MVNLLLFTIVLFVARASLWVGGKILNFPTKGCLRRGRNSLHLQGQFKKEDNMRNIQKLQWLLVFSLSASLYAADWTGATSEPESTKKIDGKVYYVITSAEELAWFAEQVNGGESEINAMLANDIQFMDDTSKTNTVNWTPIGKEYSVIFKGVFDGAVFDFWIVLQARHVCRNIWDDRRDCRDKRVEVQEIVD